jgi:hypothetical protein
VVPKYTQRPHLLTITGETRFPKLVAMPNNWYKKNQREPEKIKSM